MSDNQRITFAIAIATQLIGGFLGSAASAATFEVVRQLSAPEHHFNIGSSTFAHDLLTIPAAPNVAFGISDYDTVRLRLVPPPGMKLVLSEEAFFTWPGDINFRPTDSSGSGVLSAAPASLSFATTAGSPPAPGVTGIKTADDWLKIRIDTTGTACSADFEVTEIVLSWDVSTFGGASRTYTVSDSGGIASGPEVAFYRSLPAGSSDPGPFVWLQAIDSLGDFAVGDDGLGAIFTVKGDTGDRTLLSGCTDAICSSPVGTGPLFGRLVALGGLEDGSIAVADDSLAAVVRVDRFTGNRTILSGCTDYPSCNSILGSGIAFVHVLDVDLDEDGSLLVVDTRYADEGALLRVDPATGDRTVVSGCANDACSALVGSGRALFHPTGAMREASGEILVVDYHFGIGKSSLLRIDPATGNRTVLSGCSDRDCTSIVGTGVALLNATSGGLEADGSAILISRTVDAVVRVNPDTGNRTVVSGCTDLTACGGAPVGAGPAFVSPVRVQLATTGDILVSDAQLDGNNVGGVLLVDPVTGDRAAHSSSTIGAGPNFETPWGLTELPEPGLALSLASGAAMIAALHHRSRRRRTLSRA